MEYQKKKASGIIYQVNRVNLGRKIGLKQIMTNVAC